MLVNPVCSTNEELYLTTLSDPYNNIKISPVEFNTMPLGSSLLFNVMVASNVPEVEYFLTRSLSLSQTYILSDASITIPVGFPNPVTMVDCNVPLELYLSIRPLE